MSQSSAVPREHGRFPYSAIVDRPVLRWPNGARVAVWLIPNIEHFYFDRPATSVERNTRVPDILNYSWRDYGVRVGIWRMMEVMERHGFKGTVALNSDVCEHYPRIIEGGKSLGWEWMGHGFSNSVLINEQSEAEERELIARVVKTITASVGKAPRGWLGPALSETVKPSISWQRTASNTSATGSMTISPTRCGSRAARCSRCLIRRSSMTFRRWSGCTQVRNGSDR